MTLIEQLVTRTLSREDRALGGVVIEELKAEYPGVFDGIELSDDAGARTGRLPFYKRYALVELSVSRGRGPESVFALHIPTSDRLQDEQAPPTLWLNGGSSAGEIYRANAAEGINLAERDALCYLRFFVNFLVANDMPFTLLDAKDLIGFVEPDMTPTEQFELVATRERFLSDTLGGQWEKLRVVSTGYKACFPIAWGSHFADFATFEITNDGVVKMAETSGDVEGQFRPLGALSVRAIPAFRRISPAVLQARQAMIPADREAPEALGRRLAEASKLGEAGNELANAQAYAEANEHYDEAIGLLHDIVADYVHLLGPDHHDTIIALTRLQYWILMKNWGEPSKGYSDNDLREVRRLLAAQMRLLGSFHARTLNTRRNIALLLARNDKRSSDGADDTVSDRGGAGSAMAVAALQGLIADIREHLSADPPGVSSRQAMLDEILIDSCQSLADTHHETGDDEAAVKDLETLLALPESALPAVATAVSNAHYWLADYLFQAGRVDEAISESRARLDKLREADSPDELEIGFSEEQLARFEGDGAAL